MAKIKGNTYQFAGFELQMHGKLREISNIFAVFCGLDENPDDPPHESPVEMLKRVDYAADGLGQPKLRPLTRYMGVEELVRASVLFNDVVRMPGNEMPTERLNKDVVVDLGEKNLRRIVAMLSRLSVDETMTSERINFIPTSTLR